MMIKISCLPLNLLFCVVFVVIFLNDVVLCTENRNTYITEHFVDTQPIVIHTQERNYDKPTLRDYQECYENRVKCQKACEISTDREQCEKQCPLCPILIKSDVVVQGINDTEYRIPQTSSVNTTNIIRLTNEIRNVINNNLGNLTTRNENNIHIHDNVSSRTGGKYGLGQNETGPCCLVMRPKSCRRRRFSTAARCHHKIRRECGNLCKARVMYAKKVIRCNENDECQQKLIYVPRHNRSGSNCRYIENWPFISCPQKVSTQCHRCMELPYIYVVMNGLPTKCRICFNRLYGGSFYQPVWYASPFPYYNGMYPMNRPIGIPTSNDDIFNSENEYIPEGGGWYLEKTKCQKNDGSIIDDCANDNNNDFGSGYIDTSDFENPYSENDLQYVSDPRQEYNDYDDLHDDYQLGEVEAERIRRHIFRRSKYSHRKE